MYFTESETRLINAAQRHVLSSQNGIVTSCDSLALSIMAVRYILGSGTETPEQYKIVLCKLIQRALDERKPECVTVYAVIKNRKALESLPAVAKLLPSYVLLMQSSGYGTWYTNFEAILYTAAFVKLGGSKNVPAIVYRPSLADFLRVYDMQVAEARESRSVPVFDKADIKARLSSMSSENGGYTVSMPSSYTRSSLAAEEAGVCYRCGAEKPRKIACAICGYAARR